MKTITTSTQHKLCLITLSLIVIAISSVKAQISIGAGLIPVHASAQSDFTADQSPIDVFALYQRGSIGLRVDYHQTSSYIKDRFSFKQSGIEVSLQYGLQQLLNLNRLDPYLRLGAANWQSDFTTEGYPGIQDYELKVESDKGFGFIAAAGIQYDITPSIAIGLEGQYAKNGNAQFIAGGFDPQPLLVDQIRMMVSIQYMLMAGGSGKTGNDVNCPKF